MTDYAELLSNIVSGGYSKSFDWKNIDDASVKQVYEGFYSGTLCKELKCYTNQNNLLSASEDYDFDVSAIGRNIPKDELKQHPNSQIYKYATSSKWCLKNPNTYNCLDSSSYNYVSGPDVSFLYFNDISARLDAFILQSEYTERDLAHYVIPTKTETSSLTGIVEGLSLADATGAVLCGAGVLIAVAVLAFGAKKVMKSFR